ncbi:plasmid replication initiation protein [Lactiplantibacillus plantarum]|uniref:replication initiation protein n=1 Tax=Lactiplantibacillus plantarum TaxID=1590 RepID=UPI00130390E6|nr:replication initiation protein [Lactiplantibacillus plantarum]MCG0596637.1 plasmid replication initiation protein [Lactiplantibacillus plantarum]MCG0625310.1 plasmid replication initiation protein [Lactiplantibacillus plantarum]MCG0752339.1 plasmid replication initiation protein [Lactiplantibacillus plantarum]MCG0761544.1 plasmid replication initiation protein [Lactiplantibacillus plantarum]MCG0888590.1 plasmid replication initiation protein [Lactiplantibacillus plantarum]
MSNEIVKYDPELNTIPLRKFTPVEMNLFFSIVSRMRDKGDETVRFSFDQLKELSAYKPTANNRFIDDIESTYQKILGLRFGRRSKDGLHRDFFVMFTEFEINGHADDPYVDIKIYPKAIKLLNELESWVRYALSEFRDLKSSYAKTMFRLLKQFRTTGYAYFSVADFNELLDVPKSYKSSNINQSVLKPIKEELTPLFRGLTVRKKYGKGRGKPVIGYSFTWKSEKKNANDFSQGQFQDERQKLFNIQHNGELTEQEKWRAIDKVKGLTLGSTEKQALAVKQAEHDKKIRDQARKEALAELRKGFGNHA